MDADPLEIAPLMFISRTAHDLIVTEMRATAIGAMAARDAIITELRNQIANLTDERNFYRKEWTRSRGKAFTSASTAHTETPSLPFERPSFTQEAPFDANWGEDDRDLFQRWASELPAGVDAEEEWKRLYGSQSPLIVLTV